MPKLEICAINGVGLETTDLDRARKRGITSPSPPCSTTTSPTSRWRSALAACRRIAEGDRFVRSGKWLKGRMAPAASSRGMKAGLIGLGRIGMRGRRTASRASSATIGYVDPVPDDPPTSRHATPSRWPRDSDILFLSAAGPRAGAADRQPRVLEALGPRGIFVNIARGWLVDEPALVAALEGRLGAAGPRRVRQRARGPDALIALDNVVLTPHIASAPRRPWRDGPVVVDNIRSWFAGEGALTPVT